MKLSSARHFIGILSDPSIKKFFFNFKIIYIFGVRIFQVVSKNLGPVSSNSPFSSAALILRLRAYQGTT